MKKLPQLAVQSVRMHAITCWMSERCMLLNVGDGWWVMGVVWSWRKNSRLRLIVPMKWTALDASSTLHFPSHIVLCEGAYTHWRHHPSISISATDCPCPLPLHSVLCKCTINRYEHNSGNYSSGSLTDNKFFFQSFCSSFSLSQKIVPEFGAVAYWK